MQPYEPQEMKLGKILIVASFDYLYTPRSLFWPDVIFLTVPNLDWGQAVGMAISVQKVVKVDPEMVIIIRSNDHLQSRGLLNALMCHSARLAQRNLPAGQKKTTKGLSNEKVLRGRVGIF